MTLTRRDLGRALAPLPASAVAGPGPDAGRFQPVAPDEDPAGVRLGIALPASFGARATSADAFTKYASLAVQVVELRGSTIDEVLGAPVAPALWLPSPEEALESGLLAIEEEMLQDERDVARRSFAAQLRGWRSSAPLAPLVPLRAGAAQAGLRIELVRWDSLALMADEETDYSFRAATLLGAASVSTAFAIDGLARLAALAGRHQTLVGLRGDGTIDAADYETAFRYGPAIGAALDLAAWTAGGHGSPVPFLEQHASRVTHVVLGAEPVIDRAATPFGPGAATVRDVLQQMRDRQWPFPAIITLAGERAAGEGVITGDGWRDPGGGIGDPLEHADQLRVLEHALDYCRSCLSG